MILEVPLGQYIGTQEMVAAFQWNVDGDVTLCLNGTTSSFKEMEQPLGYIDGTRLTTVVDAGNTGYTLSDGKSTNFKNHMI